MTKSNLKQISYDVISVTLSLLRHHNNVTKIFYFVPPHSIKIFDKIRLLLVWIKLS